MGRRGGLRRDGEEKVGREGMGRRGGLRRDGRRWAEKGWGGGGLRRDGEEVG